MYKYLYNFSMFVVEGMLAFFSLFNDKLKKRYKGGKQVWEALSFADKNSKYIWFHAASLGEFEQGRPIMEALREQHPETKILLTFFSPSGYEIRKNYSGVDIVCYLPIDRPSNVKRFLSSIQIEKAIFIKYEFWRNFLRQLHRRGIPIYLVSAIFRPKQLFFKKFGGFYRSVLKNFELFFVQDELSKRLLNSIGFQNVLVSGDTRFDRVTRIASLAKELPLVELFSKGQKVIVAGSTWGKDEYILLRYLNENPKVKLIVAPHEITKSRLDELCSRLKRPYVKYSEANMISVQNADCLILDCFGLLSSTYRYGQIAYIGGGFGTGIHNTLEAAVWQIPVVFGPNYRKFKEARDLIDEKGAFSINDYQTMKTVLDQLVAGNDAGQKAGAYVASHAGASKMIMKEVFPL